MEKTDWYVGITIIIPRWLLKALSCEIAEISAYEQSPRVNIIFHAIIDEVYIIWRVKCTESETAG